MRCTNLERQSHLLTATELKRRGITRYDAEMLLSQGVSLPEPRPAPIERRVAASLGAARPAPPGRRRRRRRGRSAKQQRPVVATETEASPGAEQSAESEQLDCVVGRLRCSQRRGAVTGGGDGAAEVATPRERSCFGLLADLIPRLQCDFEAESERKEAAAVAKNGESPLTSALLWLRNKTDAGSPSPSRESTPSPVGEAATDASPSEDSVPPSAARGSCGARRKRSSPFYHSHLIAQDDCRVPRLMIRMRRDVPSDVPRATPPATPPDLADPPTGDSAPGGADVNLKSLKRMRLKFGNDSIDIRIPPLC